MIRTPSAAAAAALALAAVLVGGELRAQPPGRGEAGWNDDRALELMRRAQDRRMEAADTGLVSYRARALGRVYFYLDRQDTGERNLVKTDQLALDVLWQAPDQVKQRIVGWRDQRSLPTNIHYHLDHLSVVQENFGSEIRIGDGDEVRGVVHPAAPLAERFYEYRLVDSLTLALPGAGEPVRVYEVQARPIDDSMPGFVGSVFVERGRGDIVRMDFTFTAAAYVDPYLDYINISLDNGLWRGRYWLPNEQRVEIRRRIPQLDIPAGSVIRGNMRIGEYRFNEPLPPSTFTGPAVVALPREQREAFAFEEPIDAEVREAGLGETMELSEIRAEAARLVRTRTLQRLSSFRIRTSRVSDLARYNRAEGAMLGAGVTLQPSPSVRIESSLGYAFGAGHPVAAVGASLGESPVFRVGGYHNRPVDTGIEPAASGVMNSLSSLLAARDYTDLYYASGAEASVRAPVAPRWLAVAAVRLERHRAATLEEDYSVFGGDFREVRPIRELDRVAVGRVSLERGLASGRAADVGARLALAAGWTDPDAAGGWIEPRVDAGFVRRWRPRDAAATVEIGAGAILGGAPPHLGYLLGGRETIPGFPFRAFGGERYALVRAVASADVAEPWVRGRLLGSVGWAGGDAPPLAEPTGAPRASLGFGLGLLYDILHVDLARGLGEDGRWELVVETRHGFWDFL